MTGALRSAYWQTTSGRARVVVWPEVLSLYLVDRGGPPVSRLAERGATIARDTLRDPSGEAFIGYKVDVDSPVGSSGFPLKSGRLPSLSQALRIPVALIYNNSNQAIVYEAGYADRETSLNTRPLLTAYQRLRAMPGVTGIRTLIRNSPVGSFRKDADNIIRARIKGKPKKRGRR